METIHHGHTKGLFVHFSEMKAGILRWKGYLQHSKGGGAERVGRAEGQITRPPGHAAPFDSQPSPPPFSTSDGGRVVNSTGINPFVAFVRFAIFWKKDTKSISNGVYVVGERGRTEGRTVLTDHRGRRMGDEERDVITFISAAIVPSPLNAFRSIWQLSLLHINQVRAGGGALRPVAVVVVVVHRLVGVNRRRLVSSLQ